MSNIVDLISLTSKTTLPDRKNPKIKLKEKNNEIDKKNFLI
jgi:hypothetical protein